MFELALINITTIEKETVFVLSRLTQDNFKTDSKSPKRLLWSRASQVNPSLTYFKHGPAKTLLVLELIFKVKFYHGQYS